MRKTTQKPRPEGTFKCRICNGKERRIYSGLCDGCGHPVHNVELRPKKPSDFMNVPACPACHGLNRKELEPGRFLCLKCNAIYEHGDCGFVDDRPDINAMKKEARTNGTRRRGKASVDVFLACVVVLAFGVAGLIAAAPTGVPPIGWTTKARVVDVYDGDTITVEITRRVRVRLLDCWAPEVRTRNAAEKKRGFASRDHLRRLIKPGDAVTLHVPTYDDVGKAWSFGRVLGRVYRTGATVDVSAEQVAAGHATATKGGAE